MKTCRSLVMLLLWWCWCVCPAIGWLWSSVNKVDTDAGTDGNIEQLKLSKTILDKLISLEERFTEQFTSLEESFTERIISLEESFAERITSLDQRFTPLEQKVATLDVQCSRPQTDSVTGSHSVQSPLAPSITQGSFAFRRVSRERTAEGYTVRIEYQGYEEPLVMINWRDRYERFEEHGRVDHEGRTVDIWLSEPVHGLNVKFELKSVSYSLRLNVAAKSSTETKVTTPNMVFLPGNDVVYEKGNDAEVTVLFVDDSGEGFDDTSRLSWAGYTASEGKENTIYSYDGARNLGPSASVWSDVTSFDKKERTLEVHFYTTHVQKAAIFNFGMEFKKCRDCLVTTIHVERYLSLYPADEAGPVPPGFVGIIQNCPPDQLVRLAASWECRDANTSSVETTYCGLGKTCELRCAVLRDRKAASYELTMVKVDTERNQSTPVDFEILPSVDVVEEVVLIITNMSSSDAGQYRCIAGTESGEREKTQNLEVIQYARIVEDMSRATRPGDWELEVHCVAEGVPAPNITFDAFSWRLGSDSEYVTQIKLNETTTQADLKLSNDYSVTVRCIASNAEPGHEDVVAFYT